MIEGESCNVYAKPRVKLPGWRYPAGLLRFAAFSECSKMSGMQHDIPIVADTIRKSLVT